MQCVAAPRRYTRFMPAYIHSPPVDGATLVRRYFDLEGALATLGTRKLRLTRIDTFDDPFEGSIPVPQHDGQMVIAASRYQFVMEQSDWYSHPEGQSFLRDAEEELYTKLERLRRARTRSAHASCWSIGAESEILWRLYCPKLQDGLTKQGMGIALETTYATVKALDTLPDVFVSKIIYRSYKEGEGFKDELDHLMHKRDGFSYEHELRVLRFDDAHYKQWVPRDATVAPLPPHIPLDWPAIEQMRVVISPFASPQYEAHARKALSSVVAADGVTLSPLHSTPRF
jgi:hypothetical protein